MSGMIKYYFIVIAIIATALTIWDKCGKAKKRREEENGVRREKDDTHSGL